MITWDESKRRTHLHKHRIDLATLADVFDFPMVTDEDDREAYGEQRRVSLGFHQGRIVVMVWTERDSGAHWISCRYADKTQILRYRHEISGH